MAKRPSLAESMKAIAREADAEPTQIPKPAAEPEVSTPATSQQVGEGVPASGYRAKTREGMKRLTVVVQPEEHRRIKRLSVDTDRSIEDLMREALSALLQRHHA